MWMMGPLLKGAGASTFVIDYYVRHSPPSFLLFAVSDGVAGADDVVGVDGRKGF